LKTLRSFPMDGRKVFKDRLPEEAKDAFWAALVTALKATEALGQLRKFHRSEVRTHCHFQQVSRRYCRPAITRLIDLLQCLFSTGPPPRRVGQCTGCLSAYYCSRTCQKLDWSARHKDLCPTIPEAGSYGASVPVFHT
jgi:hypothetical protein